MMHELANTFLQSSLPPVLLVVQEAGDYGFWGPIISTLRDIGMVASGVGLVIAILIKGAAGTNSGRHALASSVAQRVFAGMFIVLLGTVIYQKIVEWTSL